MNGTKHKSFKDPGDDMLMKWVSSHESLKDTFSSLSFENQSRLKCLFSVHQQADSTVNEAIKSIARCGSDYEALDKKIESWLEGLGVGDSEEFSGDTLKLLQDVGTLVIGGDVGDGTSIGAASCLASDVLSQTTLSKQKFSLVRDVKLIKKKNSNLETCLQFFEKEAKLATKDVLFLQSDVESKADDASIYMADSSKLQAIKSTLDELGVSPSISSKVILESYKSYTHLVREVNCIQRKLEVYGQLPPSITNASKVVAETRTNLLMLSEEFKTLLTASFAR